MDVNWVEVIAAAISFALVGMLWFGPLFGKQWMALVGLKKEELKKSDMQKPMIIAFIAAIITAFVFSVITGKMGVDSMRGYIESAFWMWLAFSAMPSFVNYSYTGTSKKLWKIEYLYWLACYVVMAVIFAVL